MLLADRRVIVTGASRGLGRAISLVCAREGAVVGIGCRSSIDEANAVRDAIRSEHGRDARVLAFDVADPDAVERAIGEFVEAEGRIDGLVNNAAVVLPGLLASAETGAIERAVAVDLLGPIHCARAVLPSMLARRSGVILNVSSTSATRPGRGQAVYAASKGGVEALTRALATEYGRKGIRTLCVRPGPVETSMTEGVKAVAGDALVAGVAQRRLGRPEEVAEVVAFLLSDRCGFVNGSVHPVDGGGGVVVLELMRTRRSIRRFRPEMPARATVLKILEAATCAPSAGNRQPWRFVVLTDRAVLDRVRASVADAAGRFAAVVDPRVADAFRRYAAHFTAFADAPIVVAVLWREATLLGSMVGDASDEERGRAADMDRHDGLVSASMALQNLVLAAHAHGLGTTVMTGPRLARTALRELLEIRASWHLLALVPLGVPDEDPPAPPRKPLGRVVRWVEEEA